MGAENGEIGALKKEIAGMDKAMLNTKDEVFGDTPLLKAIKGGCTECATTLLEAGADCEGTDKWGRTPLIWAVRRNNATVAQRLIDAGADVNKADMYGYTPFKIAQEEVVGSDINDFVAACDAPNPE